MNHAFKTNNFKSNSSTTRFSKAIDEETFSAYLDTNEHIYSFFKSLNNKKDRDFVLNYLRNAETKHPSLSEAKKQKAKDDIAELEKLKEPLDTQISYDPPKPFFAMEDGEIIEWIDNILDNRFIHLGFIQDLQHSNRSVYNQVYQHLIDLRDNGDGRQQKVKSAKSMLSYFVKSQSKA